MAPRGISSFLLRAGVGVSNSIFGIEERPSVLDFVIESKLGSGQYGVVAKVRQVTFRGTPLQEQRRYALKFHAIESRRSFLRDVEILSYIARYEHAFAVKLIHFFDLRDQAWYYEQDNEPVRDEHGR